jgi:hypothetical protein
LTPVIQIELDTLHLLRGLRTIYQNFVIVVDVHHKESMSYSTFCTPLSVNVIERAFGVLKQK